MPVVGMGGVVAKCQVIALVGRLGEMIVAVAEMVHKWDGKPSWHGNLVADILRVAEANA